MQAREERVRATTLDNGVRIVTEAVPHVMTTALGVWIGAGARDEALAEHGISHLLEHMAFKGTKSRTAREIVEAIEDVGGDLNAATSLEQTAYYARVLSEDVPVAIDVLTDIVRHPLFDGEELTREKDVILQEIAATYDSPDDTVYDLAQAASFRDHAIGRPIIGTPESVTAISKSQLQSFMSRAYGPDAIVVSAAGAVDHDALVARVDAALGDLPKPTLTDASDAEGDAPQFVGAATASDVPFEQAHILLSLDGPAYHAPDFFASQVFSSLFGGGMSSRLFQEVREKRGLCYSIYSTAWAMTDCGLFMMHAATGADTVSETADV
ncbi:MAG: pitrilysin family protein, partial [Pseudomonadota bacterium]